MSLTFLATRRSSDSEGRAVVKVMRPTFSSLATQAATLAMRKEAKVAPPQLQDTSHPFIVRLIVAMLSMQGGSRFPGLAPSTFTADQRGRRLHERVDCTVADSGQSFDTPASSARWIKLRSALAEVHAAGIIHRDLSPRTC